MRLIVYVFVLDLFWEPNGNVLRYNGREYVNNNIVINKRRILTDFETIFDPLCLAGQVVVQAKLCMQHVWQLRVNLDEPLPEKISAEWLDYRKCLKIN